MAIVVFVLIVGVIILIVVMIMIMMVIITSNIHILFAYFWTPVVTSRNNRKLTFYFCFSIL